MKVVLSPETSELQREAAGGGGFALPTICPQPGRRGSQDTGSAWAAQGAAGTHTALGWNHPLPFQDLWPDRSNDIIFSANLTVAIPPKGEPPDLPGKLAGCTFLGSWFQSTRDASDRLVTRGTLT